MKAGTAGIDPTARVEIGAAIGRDVFIGPYCVIGPHVVIGDECRLAAHVYVTGHTTIGARTTILPFSSLGTPPQSVKYRGGPTRLAVGTDCDIREGVTMNTGTEDAGGLTSVGDHCMFMVGSHVGHDCHVGNQVTLANGTMLGGHVTVGDNVFFGGGVKVHQFVRVGEGVMVSGGAGVAADVIPFGHAYGYRGFLEGLNVVGMKRRGFSRDEIRRMGRLYRALFQGTGVFRERLPQAEAEFAGDPLAARVFEFIRAGGGRPLMMASTVKEGADENL